MTPRGRAVCRTFAVIVLCTIVPGLASADDAGFKVLKLRNIGPFAGGRTCRSVGIPGNPLVYYTAAASGGVWKSTDGGGTWKSIFDDQPTCTAGSIALAASNPGVIYVGSGEANIRGNVVTGNGIYKSTDGGATWKHVWKQPGQVGHIIVHPTNPDIAYAAVLGNPHAANPERGIFRTTDGGKIWRHILKKDPNSGGIDVCFDPRNPNILFAALYEVRRTPWSLTSGGPGSGLYRSVDAGDTWEQLTPKSAEGKDNEWGKGLPEGVWGRVGVAVAPSDSRRVYALIEADEGGLFRSDDGGKEWSRVNRSRYLRQRPWYFTTVHVDPQNADVVWCPNVRLLRSIDGGRTFEQVPGPHHVDHHDLWIDPLNPKRIIDSNDGGMDITLNGGETWFFPPMPLCQFYHINVDNSMPYRVMGNIQDIGTASGPSNSLSSEGIGQRHWHPVGGGETGFAVPDPKNPDIVYAGEYGGFLSIYDHKGRHHRNVTIYPTNPSGRGAEDLRYRFQWTAPLLISPHNSDVIYHAANVLFRSRNRGTTWEKISLDLTRDDRSKQKFSGGPITGDNTGAEYYCTIFAIAESPKKAGVLWAGSDDGLVHVSQNGGDNWVNVTKNVPGLPEWGTVSCIEASPHDAAAAYLVVDAHRLADYRPYLWKTADYGNTWQNLAERLPRDQYVHVVRADPQTPGLLFAGTVQGVYYSRDDGATWQQFKANLPTCDVTDLHVKDNDLVVGTNGRSIWILDDITPLREKGTQFFSVQDAYRWRYHSPVYGTDDKYAAGNPPQGAIINYQLPEATREEITLEILDNDGKRIRLLSSKKEGEKPNKLDPDAPGDPYENIVLTTDAGLNRVVWDMRYPGAKTIPRAKADWGTPERGPMVLPGVYRAKLTVAGKALESTFRVKLDPRFDIAQADLTAQLKLALELRDEVSKVSELVASIRQVRDQIKERSAASGDQPKFAPFIRLGKELIAKVDRLESELHNPKAEVAYDILAQRGGAKLYSQLIALYEYVSDSDGPVTQGIREVHADNLKVLARLQQEVADLLRDDVARLNELGRTLQVPSVIAPLPE